jgi:4-amino-4-deoxy-L-arabinose transferase-like glycosyltransferase
VIREATIADTPAPSRAHAIARSEAVALAAIVLASIAARFAFLPTRGTWDADQGTEMLVLLRLARDHVLPLLGPVTSVGGFHHGVLYYWILAPAALLSDANPTVVVGVIAMFGALAVVPIWWLGREIAGPIAGLGAAVLYAASATAIAGATAIWNPGLTPLPASLAVATAWHARRSGRSRWWLAAAASVAVTIHAHVLGVVLLVPIVALFLSDPVARTRRGLGVALACVGVLAISYLPLLAYDATHRFAETRSLVAFAFGGAGGGAAAGDNDPVAALLVVAVRVVSWPLSGAIALGPVPPLPAVVSAALVGTGVVVLLRSRAAVQRFAGAWLGGTLLWSVAALAVVAPALLSIVPGLPVDQYHAFLDPIVVVAAACVFVPLVGAAAGRQTGSRAAFLPAVGLVAAIVAWNVVHWPPSVSPDGGWPAADAAAHRIAAGADASKPLAIAGLPSFKPPDAYVFPLERIGVAVDDRTGRSPAEVVSGVEQIAIACDQLFRASIGADCGGPAEDAAIGSFSLRPVDRIEVAPGRWLSLYR